MTTATPQRPRARGFRAVAFVALTSFACTTVRAPASGIEPTVEIRGDVAMPQVELWIESGEKVSPEEAAKAAADARAALEAAMAGRNMAEGEQMLVVRAQAVSRTASRRSDQTAAVVGIVVGAVAVVAIVVVLIVATADGGGGGGRIPLPGLPGGGGRGGGVRPAGGGRGGGVRPAGGGVRPAPVPVAVPRAVAAVPRPSRGGAPNVAVGFSADVHVGGTGPADGPRPGGLVAHTVVTGPVSEPASAGEAPARAELVLPTLPPLQVASRGFFDADTTRLELTLVDRATLKPLWVKTVESDVDPRAAAAVRALLDGALDDPGGWQPAGAAL